MPVVDKPEALRLLEAYKQSVGASGCVLCAVAGSEWSARHAIAHDDHAMVLLNRFANRRGQVMVLPRRHFEHVHEVEWPVYAGLQRLAYDASIALHRVFAPARVWNAVFGAPVLGPPSYPHVHVHVVPIYETDDRSRPARVFSWSEGITIYDDAEAAELSDRVRAAWPSSG